MKHSFHLSVLLGCAAFAGATMVMQPRPALAAPQKAVCAVCKEGEEPVLATATYRGKVHYFCSENCKVQFLENPAAYVTEETPQTGEAPATEKPKPPNSAAPS